MRTCSVARASHPRPEGLQADPRRVLGAVGEQAAALWYEGQGWEVMDRNWRCREGELDLVLRRADQVVFCEVKTRTSDRFGGAAAAVTRSKQIRLRTLAMRWLAESGRRFPRIRFDVAIVKAGEVSVIEGAF